MIRRTNGLPAAVHSARIYKSGTQTRVLSTTLAAASSAGATTISTVATIPSGTSITIEGETRTTSAVSGAGPFTVTVPALTNAHASGVAVTWNDSTLASFTATPITLGQTDFKYGTAVSTATANVLTATLTGLYVVTAEVQYTGGASADRNTSIIVNGGGTGVREFGGVGTNLRPSAAATLYLAAGSTVGLSAYVGANSVSIAGGAAKDTGLTLTYLGPTA